MAAIKSPKFFWTGVMFLGTGALGLFMAQSYSFGTVSRIGPGFFPAVIGGLLILTGLLTILKSLRTEGEAVGEIHWKPLALITLSVLLFGLLLPRAGMPLAVIGSGLCAASASAFFRPGAVPLALLLAFAAVCTLAFSIGLGLPMPVLGTWAEPLAAFFSAR